MPKDFQFYINNNSVFKCTLNSTRCEAHNKTGSRCKRKVIIGFEYCFSHLPIEKHLKIADSEINGAGKGLFAYDRTKEEGDIIFRKGDNICNYNGQLLSMDTIHERYQDKTAPYAVQVNNNHAVDCACKRGIGSIANTLPGHNNATFSVNSTYRTAKLVATKNIRNGDEIYLSYGRTYKIHEPNARFDTKNKYVRRK